MLLMSTLYFFSCSPDWVELKPSTDDTGVLNEQTNETSDAVSDTARPTDTNASNHNDDTSDDEDITDHESITQVSSGTWNLSDAVVLDDPCNWTEYISSYVGEMVSTFDVLPSAFTVSGEPNAFYIKAINYGAQDNILCTIESDDFSCSLQTVNPLEIVAGWPTYWVYEIAFNGTVINENTIIGEASVDFPQINPGDAWGLGIYGLSHTECGQAYQLTLKHHAD